MGTKWQVQVWEFERGWGRRPDGCETFDTLEEAKAYQNKVNGYNTGTTVPDCYSTADDPRPVELKEPASKPTLTLADKMRPEPPRNPRPETSYNPRTHSPFRADPKPKKKPWWKFW